MSTIQLFRYHETKLKAFGPEAVQRYYDQVANPTRPSTIPISFTPVPTA